MLLVLGHGLLVVPQLEADSIGMVTGSQAGTYLQFGQDIAKVARDAGLDILVKESEGSLDNIRRMVSSENAALGIVQSDVLGFLGRSDDPQVRHMATRLRLISPFYNEEVHLLARTTIQRFEDLNDRRVVVGTQGSGNWLTAHNLLRLLNIRPAQRIELPPPEGVSAVLRGEADAMFYVAGKPVKVFTAISELQQDPRYANLAQGVHFVPLNHESMRQEYGSSAIGPNDYAWVAETIPTVVVKAVLIGFDFSSKSDFYYRRRCEQLGTLGTAIRNNFAALQRTGHPKWREVNLDEDVGIWKRDTCSQAMRQRPQLLHSEDDLLRAITDILKGKAPAR
jgi:hypothetical protein